MSKCWSRLCKLREGAVGHAAELAVAAEFGSLGYRRGIGKKPGVAVRCLTYNRCGKPVEKAGSALVL